MVRRQPRLDRFQVRLGLLAVAGGGGEARDTGVVVDRLLEVVARLLEQVHLAGAAAHLVGARFERQAAHAEGVAEHRILAPSERVAAPRQLVERLLQGVEIEQVIGVDPRQAEVGVRPGGVQARRLLELRDRLLAQRQGLLPVALAARGERSEAVEVGVGIEHPRPDATVARRDLGRGV